jgi:hypothetical protein
MVAVQGTPSATTPLRPISEMNETCGQKKKHERMEQNQEETLEWLEKGGE